MYVAPICRYHRVRIHVELCAGVGEANWSFKTEFDVGEHELAAPNADLVFDGLDTFATVTLVSLSSSHDH